MYEVLSEVYVEKSSRSVRNKATYGKKPQPFPKTEGLVTIKPEQMLSVRIPVQRIRQDEIKGYQRSLNPAKARSFARWLHNHSTDYMKELGVIEISVDGEHAYYTDGQHRAAGAIIDGKPLRAVITHRTADEARRLFANQALATRPNRNVLIFDSDGVYEEYIQDAVTDPEHPWHTLISASQKGSNTRISANVAYNMLRTFVGRMSGTSHIASPDAVLRFDKDVADELAELVGAFGNKTDNPYAFRSTSLRAISEVAREVFRERAYKKTDKERWMRHMPTFPFANFVYLRGASDLSVAMKRYWNKSLPPKSKIPV
jgi:hypothetical protein